MPFLIAFCVAVAFAAILMGFTASNRRVRRRFRIAGWIVLGLLVCCFVAFLIALPWITDRLERSLEKQYREMLGPNWHPAETTQPATLPTSQPHE